MSRYICQTCDWIGHESAVLCAPHPFDEGSEIRGCPRCKAIDDLVMVCDEPDCTAPARCGTPTVGGYRYTCGRHKPE